VEISRCDGCGRLAPRIAHRLGTACEMCGHVYLASADRRRNPQRPWTTWIQATAPRD